VEGKNVLALWFSRNILLSSERWPCRTRLTVEYPEVIPRGDPMTVGITAAGDIPRTARLRYTFETSGKGGSERLPRLAEKERNRFRMRFKNVVEPMTFWVYAGDADEGPFSVKLVERPRVTDLRFRAVYPHYTRKPPEQLATDSSYLELLEGTRLTVAATADKALVSSTLVAGDGQKLADMSPVPVGDPILGWFAAEGKPPVGNVHAAAFVVGGDAAVSILLKDTEQLENRPPTRFLVRAVPDRTPVVTVQLNGIGEMIVPAATVPMTVRGSDDYGVATLALKHSYAIGEGKTDEETVDFTSAPVGDKDITHEFRWDVAALGVQAGGVLTFHAAAADYRDTPKPNVGVSESVSLRVVTADELLAELTRRQMEQRQDFVNIRDRQYNEVKVEVADVQRVARKTGKLEEVQIKRLTSQEQRIRQSAEEVRHAATAFDQILAEMTNNRLADSRERARLQAGIIQPLIVLADDLMPGLADEARETAAATGDDLERRADALVKADEEVRRAMDQALSRMVKMESFLRIVETLRKLKQDQSDLVRMIEAERKRILESLLKGP
jgi:hypothetical protein